MSKSAFDDLCIVTWRDGKSLYAYFEQAEGYLKQGCTIRPATAEEAAAYAADIRELAASMRQAGGSTV